MFTAEHSGSIMSKCEHLVYKYWNLKQSYIQCAKPTGKLYKIRDKEAYQMKVDAQENRF